MAPRKERVERSRDLLDAYRRIRKRMPPPQKVERDRRRELREEQARRDVEDDR